MSALSHRSDLVEEILGYVGFLDMEYKAKKTINCQARVVAAFVAVHKRQMLERALSDKESFLELLGEGAASDKLFPG